MQASDEQGGNRGLLKAELENVFGKPQLKVAGSHQEVVGNKKNDVADLHRTYCTLTYTIHGGHFLGSLHQKKKTSFKLMKIAFLIFSSLS